MFQSRLLVAAGLMLTILASSLAMAEDREVIFSDDFSGYSATQPAEQAQELAKKWHAFKGHWFVKDGVLNQDNRDFDLGMVARDLNLRCDYRIECKVRLVDGGAGAGFHWNVGDPQYGYNGNMLRYDGNYPIMYGFMRGNGFVGTGGATGKLEAGTAWHDMRMDVCNSKGTFDLYWDGSKIVDAAPMFHRSGYVGLECSMGVCQFDDARISVDKGVKWKATPQGVLPEWVRSVAVLPDGNFVYPVKALHRIQVVSPDGKLVREFGSEGQEKGQLCFPGAVAVDKDGKIYVTESGNNRVQAFSSDGKSLQIIAPTGKDALNEPFGIAVDAQGRIYVGDFGNKRLVQFKPDGTIVATAGGIAKDSAAQKAPGQFEAIAHISFIDGKLYVADQSIGRLQVFDPENLSAEPRAILIPGVSSVAYDGKGKFLVAVGKGVATYDATFTKPLEQYFCDAAGEVWSDQAVFDRQGNIVIADWWSWRLLLASPRLAGVSPTVSDVTDTTTTIRWRSDAPAPTKLKLLDTPQPVTWPSTVDYSKAKECGDGAMTTDHVVKLTGLKPATRHIYALESSRRTIPASARPADFRFVTAAPEGKTAYTEIPVAVIAYGNVTYNTSKKPDGTLMYPPTRRDKAWFEHQVASAETVRYFYWTNTYFKVNLQCHYLFVERPVDMAFLGSSSEEVVKDLETLAKRDGLDPTDFGGVITVGGAGTYAYPWPTPWSGGRLSFTTGCCFTGGGGIWLFTHEFHHVTEGWMINCGSPGYCCADTPWMHAGRFGGDFDFLAHTLRYMPHEAYLNCPFGKIMLADDKDADGVPDNEPRAPWDEKRAGTDPSKKSSYGNGLTDLQNLTAENFNPTPLNVKNNNPLLTKQVDLKFPFAVFDYKYERPKRTISINGHFDPKEWDLFTTTPNAAIPKPVNPVVAKTGYAGVMWGAMIPEGTDCRMKTYMNWDDENLYFAITAPYKFSAGIALDCAADGSFHGHDNLSLEMPIPRNEKDETASPPDKLLPSPNVMVWNCKESVRTTGLPQWTNDLFNNKDKVKWAWGKAADGWYFVTVAVPKTQAVDLVPAEGKEIGVNFFCRGYLPPTEKNADPRFMPEMFDTGEYGYCKLTK